MPLNREEQQIVCALLSENQDLFSTESTLLNEAKLHNLVYYRSHPVTTMFLARQDVSIAFYHLRYGPVR
jgi:hypothetical protein